MAFFIVLNLQSIIRTIPNVSNLGCCGPGTTFTSLATGNACTLDPQVLEAYRERLHNYVEDTSRMEAEIHAEAAEMQGRVIDLRVEVARLAEEQAHLFEHRLTAKRALGDKKLQVAGADHRVQMARCMGEVFTKSQQYKEKEAEINREQAGKLQEIVALMRQAADVPQATLKGVDEIRQGCDIEVSALELSMISNAPPNIEVQNIATVVDVGAHRLPTPFE